MMRNRIAVPRRSFLARLSLGAGATLLGPFVRQLEAAQPRKRLLIVLVGNALYADRFMPPELRRSRDVYTTNSPGTGEDTTPVDQLVNTTAFSRLGPPMKPLEKYLKNMAIVDGLANRQNGPSSNHSNGSSAVTCMPQLDGAGEGNKAGGISLDQHLAASSSMGNGLFRSVDLAALQDSFEAPLFAYDQGRTVAPSTDPQKALLRYFGGFVSMDDGSERLVLAKKKMLFDLVRTDIRRLESALGAAERDKLAQYLDSIAKIEQRISAAPPSTCRAGGPPLAPGPMLEDTITGHFAIAAEALACGLTQVATISINTRGDHWGSYKRAAAMHQDPGGHDPHYLAHGEGPVGLLFWDDVWAFWASQIAAVADRLSTAVEGGQSVFSQSCILWHSDNGAHHHNPPQNRWNGVLVGDAGGRLRCDGRYIRYPETWVKGGTTRSGAPDAHSWGDFYTTLTHAFDAPTMFGAAGNEPVKGPLRELLV